MTAYRERLDAGVYARGNQTAATTATTTQLEPAQTDDQPGTDLVCDICGRGFDSEHGLKIHRTKTHGATNGEQ